MSGKTNVSSRHLGAPRFARYDRDVESSVTSAEELEKARGGQVIHTKEEFLQLKESGLGQKEIQEKWKWTHEQMNSFVTRHQLSKRRGKIKNHPWGKGGMNL